MVLPISHTSVIAKHSETAPIHLNLLSIYIAAYVTDWSLTCDARAVLFHLTLSAIVDEQCVERSRSENDAFALALAIYTHIQQM